MCTVGDHTRPLLQSDQLFEIVKALLSLINVLIHVGVSQVNAPFFFPVLLRSSYAHKVELPRVYYLTILLCVSITRLNVSFLFMYAHMSVCHTSM